jgi:transposase
VTRVQLTDEEWEFIGPYLPIGEYGPYPERLRQQFEGVIWRFKTGGQWREMPQEFGAWQTVSNRFRQWRDAGVFEALLEGLIAEAAKRGMVDLSLSASTPPPRAPTTTPPGCT